MIAATSSLTATGGLKALRGSDKPSAEDWRTQQTPNVQASERLLNVMDRQRGESPLARAVVLAEAVTNEQARLGGASFSTPIGLPGHLKPSHAVAALLGRHEVVPSAAQQQAIDALDGLGEPLAPALTKMISAFLRFEDAAFESFAYADISYLQAVAEADPPSTDGLPPASTANGTPPLATLRNAGIDVGPTMAARTAMLEAALFLQWAWYVTVPQARTSIGATVRSIGAAAPCPSEPLSGIASIVAIDMEGVDNCYTQDYLLVIDVDGSDAYENNAGRVSIDLGEDDDRHMSRNGGAHRDVGFLLDDGGDDIYVGGDGGTNGGASTGIGFLVDAGDGNDTYTAGDQATNGGAQSGAGALVDAGGNDTYTAGDDGTNGGASVSLGLPASGFLVDAGGDDSYSGGERGTNGGARSGSLGYLLDAGRGRDAYTSAGSASNGSGLYAIGFLYDVGGAGDSYVADGPDGASNGAGGLTAGSRREPGLPSPAPGAGLLLDGGGANDVYRDSYADASGTDLSRIPKGAVGAQVDRCITQEVVVLAELVNEGCV